MKAQTWTFVYARDSQPIAAFVDPALAEAYSGKSPELGETLVQRSLIIGGESRALRLLRDIVSNDYSETGDQKMQRAISEARWLLGLDPKIMSTAYADAIAGYKKTDEWKRSTDPVTIKAPADQRQYLCNRVERAYAAGFAARP